MMPVISGSILNAMALQISPDKWFCTECVNEVLPFGIKAPPLSYDKSLRPSELKRFLSQFNSLPCNKTGTETVEDINCKYYDTAEFSALNCANH